MSGDIDLLITSDDLTLDPLNEPRLAEGRACISQDIRHMIRENGYAVELVANRNEIQRLQVARKIEIEMENDVRLVPGTARVKEQKAGVFMATANTVDYGYLSFEVAA